MRGSRMWDGLRAMVLASIVGGGAVGAQASPLPSSIYYTTSGSVGEEGRDGPGVLGFAGKRVRVFFDDPGSGGAPTMPSGEGDGEPGRWSFLIGDFRVSPSTTGADTRYDQTPFTIDLQIQDAAPLTLTGTLEGTVDSSGRPDVRVAFRPTALLGTGGDATTVDLPLEFRIGDLVNRIVGFSAAPLDGTPEGGMVWGSIAPTSVPEPGTLAAWGLVGLGALSVRSRRGRRARYQSAT